MIKGYTYIMSNKNLSVLYIGATKDLKSRVDNHLNGTGAVFAKKIQCQYFVVF
jgi:putative endonuclease